MRLVIENNDGEKILEVTSDEEGLYFLKGRTMLARQEDGVDHYYTEDGYHVAGIVMAYFGAEDSRMYLRRRLNQHSAQVQK